MYKIHLIRSIIRTIFPWLNPSLVHFAFCLLNSNERLLQLCWHQLCCLSTVLRRYPSACGSKEHKPKNYVRSLEIYHDRLSLFFKIA
jgi:hypothetical protein